MEHRLKKSAAISAGVASSLIIVFWPSTASATAINVTGSWTGPGTPATVELLDNSGASTSCTVNAASKSYSCGDVPDGSYTTEFDAPYPGGTGTVYLGNAVDIIGATYVNLDAGNSAMPPQALGSIAATVTDLGRPLANAQVTIYDAGGNISLAGGLTGPNGVFTARMLPTGPVSVGVEPPSNSAVRYCGQYPSAVPTIDPTTQGSVSLHMPPHCGTLASTITFPFVGNKLKGVEQSISIFDLHGNLVATDWAQVAGNSKVGRSNVDLLPGRYRVTFATASGPSLEAPSTYRNQPFLPGGNRGTVIQVTADRTAKISVRPAMTGGRVTGIVLNRHHKPRVGVFVVVYVPGPTGTFVTRDAYTDRNGRFTVTGLQAGKYRWSVVNPETFNAIKDFGWITVRSKRATSVGTHAV